MRSSRDSGKGRRVAIDVELLKAERERLKQALREFEGQVRKLEAESKLLRQRELQSKRELEALSVLIEIHDTKEASSGG